MAHRGWLSSIVAPCVVTALLASTAATLGAPLDPYRIRFEDQGLGLTVGDLQISAPNVYDYTFTSAPTDWVPRGGTWVMQSRWTCSPQWSWYGGSGDSIAAVWNKRLFEGDLSVDMYAAFKMGLGSYSGYKNPNDMNITLFGDGANPDSGYSFIVGGGLNMFTRIMKGDAVLAETREKTGLLPIFEDGDFNTTSFHRRWWMMKAERVGDQLSLYVDNHLVLQARDPEPIPAGRVGIWTHDNGIVLARVRISYQGEALDAAPAPMPPFVPSYDVRTLPAPVFITSPTHPGVFADFESGFGQFAPRSGDDGAALTAVEGGPDGRGRALRLVNINSGGDFAATALRQPLFAGPKGVKRIDFDYKVSRDVRVNLFAKVEGGLYEIVFTGLDQPSHLAQILGAIDDVETDGRWHHAHFDLWGHLRRVFGDVDTLAIDDLFFANRSATGYLTAGFGGNRAGAAWYLDNFYIGTPGSTAAELNWRPNRSRAGEPPPVSYATAFDESPHTLPETRSSAPDTQFSREQLAPGVHFFHLRPQHADGSWGPVVHHKIVVDGAPPSVVALSPEPDSHSAATDISVRITDNDGVGVDPRSLALAIDGTEKRIAAAGVRYDAVTRTLRLDPTAAHLAFEDGQRVELELTAGSDYLGQSLAERPAWSFTVSYKDDDSPPPPPTVTAATPYLCNDTFEHDMGEWVNYGSANGAIVSRDSTTAASGKYSLKLYNRTNGGLFGAYARKTPFDAGKYRRVSFDYRINDRIRVDFVVYFNGKWRSIAFTDNDNPFEKIGEVPGVVRDDQWHHAEFDLYQMLSRIDPDATNYTVRNFIVADWGTMANTQHAAYWIDNFRIMPVVPSGPKAAFTWASWDPSGILGVSWAVDRAPDTVPAQHISDSSREIAFTDPIHGSAYLHVRASDRAGNWSDATHYPVLVDGLAPTVGAYGPTAGSTASSRIQMALSDEGGAGIDPASIVLSVCGTKYGVTNPGLIYDAASSSLVWEGQLVSPKPVVFADGQEVPVALVSVADYAGNVPPELPQWSWTMDYSKDSEAPVVEGVSSTKHPTAVTDTFEFDLGEWAPGPGAAGTATVERDPTTAATGRFSAKITCTGTPLSVLAVTTSYKALANPIVSFDYKVPPGLKVDLTVAMDGAQHTITFTGDPVRGASPIPDVKADGQWHRASFNLVTPLRRQGRRGAGFTVEQILFAADRRYGDQAGKSFHIDNLIIGAPGTGTPELTWTATDPTGITDYSYVLDDQPATIPDEIGEGPATGKRFGTLQKGLYYFHIRASDGAGHWGPAYHYAVMHLGPPPSQ